MRANTHKKNFHCLNLWFPQPLGQPSVQMPPLFVQVVALPAPTNLLCVQMQFSYRRALTENSNKNQPSGRKIWWGVSYPVWSILCLMASSTALGLPWGEDLLVSESPVLTRPALKQRAVKWCPQVDSGAFSEKSAKLQRNGSNYIVMFFLRSRSLTLDALTKIRYFLGEKKFSWNWNIRQKKNMITVWS